jgi:hypothetical protein
MVPRTRHEVRAYIGSISVVCLNYYCLSAIKTVVITDMPGVA